MNNYRRLHILIYISILTICASCGFPEYNNNIISIKDERTMVIKITKQKGTLIFDNQPIDDSKLSDQLARKAKEYGLDAPIVLTAPNDIDFNIVGQVLQLISEEGFYSIYFRTNKGHLVKAFFPSIPTNGFNITILRNNKYALNGENMELVRLSKELKLLYEKKYSLYVFWGNGCKYQDFLKLAEASKELGYEIVLKGSQPKTANPT